MSRGQAAERRLEIHEPPKPPKHLSAEAREWWCHVVQEYQLEEHHLKLLRLAAEAWDRAQQARVALAKYGMTYTDRFGAPHPRPEIAVERDSRVGFARVVRELGFDVSNPESRPPRRDRRY
jgi:P27 family predicted phage terminase small subunit